MASTPSKRPPSNAPSPSKPFLESLYIFNPSIGQTDTTAHEQIIYHYFAANKHRAGSPPHDKVESQHDIDRQLRAVGLAQGIVEFARAFSPDSPVQEVRTQKGFTVPVEVEKGWWILATVHVPSPSPSDLITPFQLCNLIWRAYRLHRLQFRTFTHLLSVHSREFLVSIISPYYEMFVRELDLTLSKNGVEMDFDALRWSCEPLNHNTQRSLGEWTRKTKSEASDIINVLLYRQPRSNVPYKAPGDGLLFAGLQDGSLSPANIRDISLLVSNLRKHQLEKKATTNGEAVPKRSVNLPSASLSWDSVVQTSSNLFSALSFGNLPAKRSPLSAPADKETKNGDETDMNTAQNGNQENGAWLIGGDKEPKKVWLEVTNEPLVPISLGNQRPGFLRDLSNSQLLGEDNLIEVELSIYKYSDLLLVFVLLPSGKPPESFLDLLQTISSPSTIPRPQTPPSQKPFILLHDPLTLRLYSTIPPLPPPPPPQPQSFTLSPKRQSSKRDPWPHSEALELTTHILRLRETYTHSSPSSLQVREFTAKTNNFFIFRTLISSEERSVRDFAEGWYIVRIGSGSAHAQVGAGANVGLGRGDDAGGLEDVARQGRDKCREIWRQMNFVYKLDESENEESDSSDE